jgi:ABC-type nitrate/sulfonate/bicarbonate transport system ATPase subunit
MESSSPQTREWRKNFISIKGLSKAYVERRRRLRKVNGRRVPQGGRIQVLDNLDIDIDEGELVCILGPSGCGKSTLLRIITGFDLAFTGQVMIDNKEVKGPSSDHIFVFQHGGLLPWLTVSQNVELGLRHMPDKELMAKRVQEYIDMVELTNFEQFYPNQLSGGMQRLAELARALAVDPEIVFMDEPFTGLDFFTHMKIREEVLNLHEFTRKTILMVTHDVEDALIMGDRIIVLCDRPAKVKLARKLDFPRPRDFAKDPEMNALRTSIYVMLGVNYAL